MTTITLTPELEDAVAQAARKQAITPETLVLETLREKFSPLPTVSETQNAPLAWEAMILGIGFDAGVSLADQQVSVK